MENKKPETSGGCCVIFPVGFGGVLAMILSYTTNHSILWCLLHGFFGWFYVIYYLLGGGH